MLQKRVLAIVILLAMFASFPLPLAAQTRPVRSSEVWQQVYKQLPDFPLENQYISRESGKVNPENTLVSRLIRYHTSVVGRAPNYRLDWKLTLADYLGVNAIMDAAIYPGAESLRENPFERDRAAIQRLNRKQRDVLIQAIVNAYSTP